MSTRQLERKIYSLNTIVIDNTVFSFDGNTNLVHVQTTEGTIIGKVRDRNRQFLTEKGYDLDGAVAHLSLFPNSSGHETLHLRFYEGADPDKRKLILKKLGERGYLSS